MEFIKDLGMLYPTKTSKRKARYGIYICSGCFTEVKALTNHVKAGNITQCKSCGNSTHGESTTRLYKCWLSMKTRCYDKNTRAYKTYGALGITVCDDWLNDYGAFSSWALSNGYKEDLQIDKDKLCHELGISPKIYSPKTCLWVTQAENTQYRDLYPN